MTHPAVVMLNWHHALLVSLIALPLLFVAVEGARWVGERLGDLLWWLACQAARLIRDLLVTIPNKGSSTLRGWESIRSCSTAPPSPTPSASDQG